MLLLLMACAPLYRPGLATTPMFEDAGDLQAYGGASAGGMQGGVAWAPAEHVGVRGNLQTAGPAYTRLSAGVGGWMAGPFDPGLPKDTGIRLGLWADGGVGAASGSFAVTIGETTSVSSFSGNFFDVGAQALVAFEAPRVASGLSLRGAFYQVTHDEGSDATGHGRIAFVEPMLFARAGGEHLKGELQLGGWLPVWIPENTATIGVPLPINVGFALVYER